MSSKRSDCFNSVGNMNLNLILIWCFSIKPTILTISLTQKNIEDLKAEIELKDTEISLNSKNLRTIKRLERERNIANLNHQQALRRIICLEHQISDYQVDRKILEEQREHLKHVEAAQREELRLSGMAMRGIEQVNL